MSSFVVTSADRELFTTCRRAWDFGAGVRRGLEPVRLKASHDLGRAIRQALAVYYFPGMWAWDRGIVLPLVLRAYEESMREQRARFLAQPRTAGMGRVPPEPEAALLGDEAWETDRQLGRTLLEAYFEWAPSLDRFTPLRVETDFEVHVPDPIDPGRDLAAPDGCAVHYSGRIDVLLAEATESPSDLQWLMFHRIITDAGDFSTSELLVLDEAAISACWAWERFQLGSKLAGTVFNELVVGAAAGFRRTRIERSRCELDRAGDRIAGLAWEMTVPSNPTCPSPAPAHCGPCAFLEPCIAMNRGGDLEDLLRSSYRRRTEDLDAAAGRLGGVSWSLGRGAAPPRFDRRRDDI